MEHIGRDGLELGIFMNVMISPHFVAKYTTWTSLSAHLENIGRAVDCFVLNYYTNRQRGIKLNALILPVSS